MAKAKGGKNFKYIPIKMGLGPIMLSRVKELNLTGKQVAEKLGFSEGLVNGILAGRLPIREDYIPRFEEVLALKLVLRKQPEKKLVLNRTLEVMSEKAKTTEPIVFYSELESRGLRLKNRRYSINIPKPLNGQLLPAGAYEVTLTLIKSFISPR